MDLDFATLAPTCCQIDLLKLFKDGFNTGHGHLREPNDIQSYAALACIAIQSDQNDCNGGQSIPNFDYSLAPGVSKTYHKLYKKWLAASVELYYVINYDFREYDEQRIQELVDKSEEKLGKKLEFGKVNEVDKQLVKLGLDYKCVEFARDHAVRETRRKTYQAMEALVHNLNTMQCRAGSQVPFSSLNYGTDTSPEGRLVMEQLLLATEAGLGNGETPIFPIQIFKVKEGVNYNPEDPNYDLFKLACRVSAKRMFPNFSFLDSSFNLKYYKQNHPETEATYMGAVSGDNIVRYIIDETIVCEDTFERAFEHLSSLYGQEKLGLSLYVNLDQYNVTVADSSSGRFVKARKIIKNPNLSNWMKIIFTNEKFILCTNDHPLPIKGKGRVMVKDMRCGDMVPESHHRVSITHTVKYNGTRIDMINSNQYSYLEIKEIEKSNYDGFGYDFETESDKFDVSGIISHNCRTRVMGNIVDPSKEVSYGRGNVAFTSINLPMLALKNEENVDKFMEDLDKTMDIVIDQLLDRYEILGKKKLKNLPFLMGQGVWIDSEELSLEDDVEKVLKHGTLSCGFVGLAETLVALTGKHHGESEDAQQLGLKIIGHMREYMDNAAKKYNKNFTLLATPAESLAGRFLRITREKYGIIPGVTDKDYFVNSFHIPPAYHISAYEKIKKEAPYHALTNAGHISYVELDGDPTQNIEAFESVVRCMKESGIGYGAINHPIDRDPVCGYTGIIKDVCPRCGRRDGEGVSRAKLIKLGAYRDYNSTTVGYHGDVSEEEDRNNNPND